MGADTISHGGGAPVGESLAERRARKQRERREKKTEEKRRRAHAALTGGRPHGWDGSIGGSRWNLLGHPVGSIGETEEGAHRAGVGPGRPTRGPSSVGGGREDGKTRLHDDGMMKKKKRPAGAGGLCPPRRGEKRARGAATSVDGEEHSASDGRSDEMLYRRESGDDEGYHLSTAAEEDEDEDVAGQTTGRDGAKDATQMSTPPPIEPVTRTGAYGSYGQTGGRMSIEDDEWATAPRTWAALSPYLSKFHDKKVWMPFYYDGGAGRRLKEAGFARVVHKKEDFFKRVNDGPFVRSVDVVIDNPPYTGKGMKERVLQALVDADVPFCLLLPLGVLHGAMLRQMLDPQHVQALIPRRCWVSKQGGREVPFKYLVWICYKLELDRDLVLMTDT